MAARSKGSSPDEFSSPSDGFRPRLPPLKALHAFEAACRLGSFAAGAKELGVTPSAISHQVQQLEAFLGTRLFARQAGRAVLTGAGRSYAGEIKTAFAVIRDATLVASPQSQAGHLVIAASPSFAARWLQPRLSGFLRDLSGREGPCGNSEWSGRIGEGSLRHSGRLRPSIGWPGPSHSLADRAPAAVMQPRTHRAPRPA